MVVHPCNAVVLIMTCGPQEQTLSMEAAKLNYTQMLDMIAASLAQPRDRLDITYTDEDGDIIQLASQGCLVECIRCFASRACDPLTLHLTVSVLPASNQTAWAQDTIAEQDSLFDECFPQEEEAEEEDWTLVEEDPSDILFSGAAVTCKGKRSEPAGPQSSSSCFAGVLESSSSSSASLVMESSAKAATEEQPQDDGSMAMEASMSGSGAADGAAPPVVEEFPVSEKDEQQFQGWLESQINGGLKRQRSEGAEMAWHIRTAATGHSHSDMEFEKWLDHELGVVTGPLRHSKRQRGKSAASTSPYDRRAGESQVGSEGDAVAPLVWMLSGLNPFGAQSQVSVS